MPRTVLLSFELGADPRDAVALVLALAPAAESVLVVARLREASGQGLAETQEPHAQVAGLESLEARARVHVELALPREPLAASLPDGARPDLVVLGPFPGLTRSDLAAAAVEAGHALQAPVAVLGADGAPRLPIRPAPIRHVAVAFASREDLAAAASRGAGWREGLERVSLLAVEEPPVAADELASLAALGGLRAALSLERVDVGRRGRGERIAEVARERGADLLVLPPDPGGLGALLAPVPSRAALEHARGPALLLAAAPPLARAGELDAPDVLATGAIATLLVEETAGRGRAARLSGVGLAIVAEGMPVVTVAVEDGEALLPVPAASPGPSGHVVALGRPREGTADPLATVEATVRLVHPGSRPVVLVDSRLAAPAVGALAAALASAPLPWLPLGVRLTRGETCRQHRARLAAAGLEDLPVLDARQVLAEGDPLDVLPDLDAVRLARVASRLRASGVSVGAIVVVPGPRPPLGNGFAVLLESETAAYAAALASAPAAPTAVAGSLAARLDECAASASLPGHAARVHLENALARSALERLIHEARERVHVQVYIAADDPVTAEIERALVAAARRGVRVRVLADSLLSRHGSFGATNALLARLAAEPGTEVRAIAPIERVPTTWDLKQRDHRKLAIQDGRVAIVTGRNLARSYYLGFEEVRLGPGSPWSDVPWLDAGAEVEGPAVATFERSFLRSWTAAGGQAYDVADVPMAGGSSLRAVVHQGGSDARTLEAYLALIDHARASLLVVNCFPLQLEVQRAFARALRRGVRVRFLTGNIRPLHDGGSFPGGSLRDLATDLVQSRLDPLMELGAEVRELAIAGVPGWDPALGRVRPHVHAKVLLADGERAAVGSANLDITAGYWESEALVLLEDARVVREVEAEVERRLAGSIRITPDDERHRGRAGRRAWLGKHWPTGVLG